jgi:hypothetical protein
MYPFYSCGYFLPPWEIQSVYTHFQRCLIFIYALEKLRTFGARNRTSETRGGSSLKPTKPGRMESLRFGRSRGNV